MSSATLATRTNRSGSSSSSSSSSSRKSPLNADKTITVNSTTTAAARKTRKRKTTDEQDQEEDQIFRLNSVGEDPEQELRAPVPNLTTVSTAAVPMPPVETLAEKRRRLGILSFHDHVIDIEFTHNNSIVLTLRFLASQNSLYDVAESFFQHYMSKRLKGLQLYSHSWTLDVHTNSEDVQFDSSLHSPDSAGSSEVNPHPFANFLELNIGDTMVMRYNQGSTVADMRISAMALATEDDAAQNYPIVVNKGHKKSKPKAGKRGVGSESAAPAFLTFEEKALSHEARADFELQTPKMEWSQRQNKYVSVQKPNWSQAEEEAMCFLIYANVPFSEAWSEYLQYCILSRSRAATSGKWYDEKKIIAEMDSYHRTERYLFYGDQYTVEECLPRALKVLASIRTGSLKVYKSIKKI